MPENKYNGPQYSDKVGGPELFLQDTLEHRNTALKIACGMHTTCSTRKKCFKIGEENHPGIPYFALLFGHNSCNA